MKLRHLLLLLVAVGAFVAGIFFAVSPKPPQEPASGGYVLDEPRPVPPFELLDEQGRAFTQEDFRGHWSLLYFGFTYCPDICPGSMVVMADVKRRLAGESSLDDRYYLVSVDPDRDSTGASCRVRQLL